MKKLFFLLKYFRYRIKALDKHGVHSPFVFHLITEIFENKNSFYAFNAIEKLRQKMILSSEIIVVEDFGAGSKNLKTKKRAVKDIAKTSVKPTKYGQLLFRLIHYFEFKNILELGTSLGITTLYLAMPDSNAKVISIEGCPQTAALAKNNFSQIKCKNIELIIGNFDEKLSASINKLQKLDFVFFDGNHRKEATLKYFNECLKAAHNDSLFVFDDIHWSAEMENAWEMIQKNNSVTVTIDLFFMGFVFFRKELTKQDFIVKF
ncbi:MAG: class I SAM-dependent methyltransferase [Bacteroidia bacterium]